MLDTELEAAQVDLVLQMTTEIVASYVSNNSVTVDSLPDLIRSVHATLNRLTAGEAAPEAHTPAKPAVPVKKSITDDYIICLEDGKPLKMLKRYLRSRYDMSPDDYRAKWNLPADYPMVAPNYAARRSEFAKQIGLGKQSTSRRGRRK